ncbi:MAG TPA: hypothetical protein VM581_05030, partial [Magnetospirillaceae bacterium]|nr:hypothetical protein [Magnetospirillaceae bacterium]
PFEFDGEPGVLWRKLNIRSLITFATELTGLGVGPINDAHKWMRDNGFRHKDGSGTAVKHYILMAPPAGSNPEGSADEVADTLAAAMDTITRLTTENDLLKEENHRLRTERNPSSDAPPGTRITGLARQLQSMIDSE